MDPVERRYSKEEIARRGDAIYRKDILPKLTAKDRGKFLAIDIETGEYEMARDEMRACNKVRTRIPQAAYFDGAGGLCRCPQLRGRTKNGRNCHDYMRLLR